MVCVPWHSAAHSGLPRDAEASSYSNTLQKQVGCFSHRVVTLVADKLETERFTLVWKTIIG